MIKKYQEINLDTASYTAVDLDGVHEFYLVSVTDDKSIKKITFSTAVDSGVSGKLLWIGNISIDVTDEVSGGRFTGYPEDFWMKPIQVITTDDVVHTTGVYDVEVNLNNVALQ